MVLKKIISLCGAKGFGAIVFTICYCAMSLRYSHLDEKYLILRCQSVVASKLLDQIVYSELIHHALL